MIDSVSDPVPAHRLPYPWQQSDWLRWRAARANLPHAFLLHGQAGIGKTAFARHMAYSLLCEAPDAEGHACARCPACAWLDGGNHPDFRLVLPEALAEPVPLAVRGAAQGEEGSGKKPRAPSKAIKIEQVRALMAFSELGSHRGGMRVVLLYPAESLNTAAANALLKTLEEPPEGLVFILVTARLDRLLPTIVSRCRQWPMSAPAPAAALAWLRAGTAADGARGRDPEALVALLAEAGGAPLTALARLNDPYRALQRFTLERLGAGSACDAFACGEELQKVPVPEVLGWLQRWTYDLLAQREAGRVRYYPDARAALRNCADALGASGAARLARFARVLQARREAEHHPLNARLVLEELFMSYRALFNPGEPAVADT